MSFLASAYTKLRAVFSTPTMNATQAWQAGEGKAAHAFWLYAAPVNMVLGRDSFFLSAPVPLSLSSDESTSLIESLNQHFANDGYHFYCLNDVWFLGLEVDPKITTTHVDQVVNHDIAPYLPTGEGALAWAALQNEIQMLLFKHPVNEAREAQGLPVMNSLWCYGLGAAA
ncbi:MAG: hypothetical protein V3U89_01010 [Methylophilaceae bacterium]